VIPEVRSAPLRSTAPRQHRGDGGAAATDGDGGGNHQVPATPLSPDVAASIADEVARRTELVMVAQRKQADADELVMDRVRTQFDLHEQERAEYLREWNAIRDLAMEQMKKDDDILKKWIALI
jgi:hypothetical protein